MKRYDIETSIGEDYEPVESSDGEYVYYTDHLAVITELEAIVAKLPMYADTGERFVPSVDPAWCIVMGEIVDAQLENVAWDRPLGEAACRWRVNCEGEYWSDAGPFYSTREAALAQLKEQPND
jgi:hypothetical protein